MAADFLMIKSVVPPLESVPGKGEGLSVHSFPVDGEGSAPPGFGSLFLQATDDLAREEGEAAVDLLPPDGKILPQRQVEAGNESEMSLSLEGLAQYPPFTAGAEPIESGGGAAPPAADRADTALQDAVKLAQPGMAASEPLRLPVDGSDRMNPGDMVTTAEADVVKAATAKEVQRGQKRAASSSIENLPPMPAEKGVAPLSRGSGEGASTVSAEAGTSPQVALEQGRQPASGVVSTLEGAAHDAGREQHRSNPAMDRPAQGEPVQAPGGLGSRPSSSPAQEEAPPRQTVAAGIESTKRDAVSLASNAQEHAPAKPATTTSNSQPVARQENEMVAGGFLKQEAPVVMKEEQAKAVSTATPVAMSGQMREPVQRGVARARDVAPEDATLLDTGTEAQKRRQPDSALQAPIPTAAPQRASNAGKTRSERGSVTFQSGGVPPQEPVHREARPPLEVNGDTADIDLELQSGEIPLDESVRNGIPQPLSRGIPLSGSTINTHPTVAANPATDSRFVETALDEPLGHEAWEKSMARQVLEHAGNGEQRARLRLNPANLGALDVRITTEEGEARVQFSSQHTVVREAVEAALPRLREMFQGSGIDLVEVDVSRQGFADQRQSGGGANDQGQGAGTGVAPVIEGLETTAAASTSSASDSLIDYYA